MPKIVRLAGGKRFGAIRERLRTTLLPTPILSARVVHRLKFFQSLQRIAVAERLVRVDDNVTAHALMQHRAKVLLGGSGP